MQGAYIEQLPDAFPEVEALIKQLEALTGSDRLDISARDKHTGEGRRILTGLYATELAFQLGELMRQANALRGFIAVVGTCLQAATTNEAPNAEGEAEA